MARLRSVLGELISIPYTSYPGTASSTQDYAFFHL